MTKDELHTIYMWAQDCALHMFSHDQDIDVIRQTELMADKRLEWVKAKANEVSA